MVAWTVVIRPSMMPNSSLMTFARGAKQFYTTGWPSELDNRTRRCSIDGSLTVVHDALEMTVSLGSYASRFTPTTYMGASAEGAEMTTFFAPPFKCAAAFSLVVNTP